MNAQELLNNLRARGVRLWVDGTDLRFRAPRDTLGLDSIEQLARHKSELIQLLRTPSSRDTPQLSRSGEPAGLAPDTRPIALSSVTDWCAADQHPYVRYVAPYKGFLYQRLAMDKVFVRGEGCYLFDADGASYADFIAQFGAVPFGHDPAPIWRALDMARRDSQPNLVTGSIPAAAGALADQLLAVAPRGLAHVALTDSDIQAIDAAIQLARSRTGRIGILTTHGASHGLTLSGLSAIGEEYLQLGLRAPPAGFDSVPFGDLAKLQSTLELRPDFFAAVVVGIIQGEAGVHVAPPGYLLACRNLCQRFGALLIVDETQTGLGRTGHLFACEAEAVTPDILVLANALGGGVMPIGACLYTADVYTEHFELRHGSCYAGNTLSCRAALATIKQLISDDRRLVRQVSALGQRLQEQLRRLQSEYPMLVREIRGRGLMLGLELDLDHVAATQNGLLAVLQKQGLLLYIAASFLLNSQHVRVAPSNTKASVLRIQPPLIADAELCDQLIVALKRLLDILHRGDAGQLLGHFANRSVPPTLSRETDTNGHPLPRPAVPEWQSRASERTRFAFVVHLLEIGDLRRFDSSLERLSDTDLGQVKSHLANFIKPFPVGELVIRSADGMLAEGELIMLPHLPSELLALSGNEAICLVQAAVDLAAHRGAQVIGLGGLSAIIADGGLAVRPPQEVNVTSGNSLKTWAAVRAVESASAQQGLALADCIVAIVGATSAIGHALALLYAERASELILVGDPYAAEASTETLHDVAQDCVGRVAILAASGAEFAAGTVAARAAARGRSSAAPVDAGITITTNIDQQLPRAHIVLNATNALPCLISRHHLRQRAVVCDVSRPASLAPDLGDNRPDLRLVSGGLIQAPETAVLGHLQERDQPNVLVACAAETIILALSRYQARRLCGQLDITTIQQLGELAEKSGFSVVT